MIIRNLKKTRNQSSKFRRMPFSCWKKKEGENWTSLILKLFPGKNERTWLIKLSTHDPHLRIAHPIECFASTYTYVCPTRANSQHLFRNWGTNIKSQHTPILLLLPHPPYLPPGRESREESTESIGGIKWDLVCPDLNRQPVGWRFHDDSQNSVTSPS